MKNIAIFQSDLRVGGIQKALLNILQELDYSKVHVDVFLYDSELFFDLPSHENLDIHFETPYPFATRFIPFPVLLKTRKMPKAAQGVEYDTAVDFNSYRMECAVGACLVKAKRRVMWIHNDVEIKLANEPKYRLLHNFFKSKYRYFDEFAAVSPGIIDPFRRVNREFSKPITCVPNHVDTKEIFAKRSQETDVSVDPGCYNLCSMGRLFVQKGYDILIDIMAQVHKARPDMKLYIMGDGPDREKLTQQRDSLGLTDTVIFLGNRKNPFPILDQMDGFALTSRYEGQGIVIWEAKTLGLELFITKNLEKYNPSIEGREDMVSALISARRREKKDDDLSEYNAAVSEAAARVLGLGKGEA